MKLADAVLSVKGSSLQKTGEVNGEVLVQRSMPKDLARVSLLGFLEEIKAFHDRPGVDTNSVRLWLGYQLTALLASRMAGSTGNANWVTLWELRCRWRCTHRPIPPSLHAGSLGGRQRADDVLDQ